MHKFCDCTNDRRSGRRREPVYWALQLQAKNAQWRMPTEKAIHRRRRRRRLHFFPPHFSLFIYFKCSFWPNEIVCIFQDEHKMCPACVRVRFALCLCADECAEPSVSGWVCLFFGIINLFTFIENLFVSLLRELAAGVCVCARRRA